MKFILQPIVENIFEHGFTMDENDNKIWIKAFKCENDIVILVKDNGCGIDSEKREELNRILCERTRRISYIDEEEKSIGINNVNTRIKNYYGEKYGVKVNKADKGTEIQLLLGIENLEEENKDKGYIRYVGVSNFTAEQIKEAEQYIQIDVQQPLYSMVDRGFEDLMSWGYDRGIDSMTYGSMGAGILSGKIRSVPSFEKNDLRLNFYDVYKEPKFSKIMELLKVMDSIADGHNVPVGQVALNWSTQKEYVGTALVGVRSIEHADENCKTFDWKLTEEEMKILDSKIEECAL